MSLQRLDITAVRNLRRVRLQGFARTNIFHGDNGSGKTSLLESIHLLGLARSFRSGQIKSLITRGEPSCTVYGELAGATGSMLPVGVTRGADGSFQARLAGEQVRTTAALAEQLPLQVINADSFNLLVGPPAERRQFIDWGVFHVEHQFYRHWQRFQRALKQRNSLLRHAKMMDSELRSWNREFSESGEQVDAQRRQYFEALGPIFAQHMSRLAPELTGLSLRYRRGWDSRTTLADALQAMEVTDVEQGFTHAGPQRADVRVQVEGQSAAEVLSRGQQKLVVSGLKLAQGALLGDTKRRACVYLVDDLPAELDQVHCRRVAEVLDELGSQVFITSVEPGSIVDVWPGVSGKGTVRAGQLASKIATFHVEQGAVSKD